jgi:hypothetical protein
MWFGLLLYFTRETPTTETTALLSGPQAPDRTAHKGNGTKRNGTSWLAEEADGTDGTGMIANVNGDGLETQPLISRDT